MKQIDLFTADYKSLSTFLSAQTRLNVLMYVTKGERTVKLSPFRLPGLTLWVTGLAGPVQGWWVGGDNNLYVAAGAMAYLITPAGTVTVLGSLSSGSGTYVGVRDNATQVIFVDGVAGWIYNKATFAFTQITDPSFPNGTTSVTYNDTYFICPQPNSFQWWVSNPGDGTTWNAFNGTAETYPDSLVRSEVLTGVVLHFKQLSVEFHQDVGQTPFPFQVIPQTTLDWGLAAFGSLCYFANTYAFLSVNRQNQYTVRQLNGTDSIPISDPDMDTIINGYAAQGTITDAVSLAFTCNGHHCYQITFPTAGHTWVYDGSTKIWSERQTGIVTPPIRERHQGNFSIQFAGDTLISDYETGNIYIHDNSNYTDNGIPTRIECTSRLIDEEGNQLLVAEMELEMERGSGNMATGTTPNLMIEKSLDHGNTWRGMRTLPIGNPGQYDTPRIRTLNFGAGRSFVFRFSMTDPAPFVLVRAFMTIKVGSQSQQGPTQQ